jgi:hypothetical protein
LTFFYCFDGLNLIQCHELIEDLQKGIEETQQKLEQGSNKLTGETTEILLREYLRQAIPIDSTKAYILNDSCIFRTVKKRVDENQNTDLSILIASCCWTKGQE